MIESREVRPFNVLEEPKIFSPFLRQFIAASPSIMTAANLGMVFGYTATLLPELQSPNSDIKVTPDEASWIASTVPLLMTFSCLLCGPIMQRYGRKPSQFILCIPNLLGWIFIYFASDVTFLIIGRLLSGFAAGFHSTLFPAYIGEISDPRYRGVFISGPSLAVAIGMLTTHLLGTFYRWRTVALIGAVIPLVQGVILIFVPESPIWFISKNRFDDAVKSFKWLRGSAEIYELEDAWENYTEVGHIKSNICPTLFEAFRKPEFMKPFFIIFTAFIMMQFAGPYIVAVYSVTMLEGILGSSMDEYLIMIVIDVLRLVMVVTAVGLLKIWRRRLIMIVSGIGTALSAFALGAFLLAARKFTFVTDYSWIAVVTLVSYTFFVSIGIFVLPWCMAGELLPMEYRGLGTSLNVSLNYLLFFFAIKMAPKVFSGLGMDGTFLIFSIVSIVGTLILYATMPETKNRTLVDIERYFRNSDRYRRYRFSRRNTAVTEQTYL